MQTSDDRRLIVGIDFGTTYTGIGWAQGEYTDGRQWSISDWPSSLGSEGGSDSLKVPTILRYLNNREIEWGYQVPDDAQPQDILSLFKLGLEPEKYENSNVDKNITDYLTGVFEHFSKIVQRQIGSNTTNDSFVVVDAGGGTVDLITYTISSLSPRFEVTEATEGTGDFCGSARLNDRFIKFLTSRLGGEEGWDDEVLHGAVAHFERSIKRKLDLKGLAQGREFTIPVVGLGANPEDQIAMADVPIKKILLVGGYGSSIYLRERLEISIREDSSISNDIEILQPPNAWISVVRGAVMKGISLANPVNYDVPIVKARAARKHYGYPCGKVFDPNEHKSLLSEKYYDGFSGCWRVSVMDWIIRRGELVSENNPFLRTYHLIQPTGDGRPNSMTTMIYSDQVSNVAPLQRNDKVKLLCSVTADLSHIPENELEQTLGVDGQMYYDLEYQIESIYRSASTEYTLIVTDNSQLLRRPLFEPPASSGFITYPFFEHRCI
ncbi:hypothetical protein F5Y02DRAFT_412086 [Annulohypoxylon stygium]|nr:hypothetical protein F5Y02DRAFT_412086 [Annulohypoxylon stygium]